MTDEQRVQDFADTRVLIVDDVPSARRVTAKLLKKAGVVSLDEAENGAAAMEKLAAGQTDLVICDWQMPDMNGMELLAMMRNDSRFATIPFIMITSTVERTSVIAALQAGASDYIVKPFSYDILCEKVKAALMQRTLP